MKRPLFLYVPLGACIALIGYALFIWEPEQAADIAEDVEAYLSGEPRTGIFDDIEPIDPEIAEKTAKRLPLTEEEWKQIYKRRIRLLEKIDEKAARLEEELQEQGYLPSEDYEYLAAKLKELEKIVIREAPRKFMGHKRHTDD